MYEITVRNESIIIQRGGETVYFLKEVYEQYSLKDLLEKFETTVLLKDNVNVVAN